MPPLWILKKQEIGITHPEIKAANKNQWRLKMKELSEALGPNNFCKAFNIFQQGNIDKALWPDSHGAFFLMTDRPSSGIKPKF